MSETFLDMITAKKRAEIADVKASVDTSDLMGRALDVRSTIESNLFHAAISRKDRINIIAEIKRASPSKGIINADIDVSQIARKYENGGAAAVSVLTEKEYFQGSLDDLRIVRKSVDLPILRKDFIVDEIQIYEAALAGADAILLIVAALDTSTLEVLLRITEDELGMDALVEVHTLDELCAAAAAGAKLIGVNNRDLHSLEVSLDVSRALIDHKPENTIMICESGLSARNEIEELRTLGFDGFLIGETLMRSGNVEGELRLLMGSSS